MGGYQAFEESNMTYLIGEIAEKLGVTAHTLRFYDKKGLLPFVEKNESGTRIFKESDIEWLTIIDCLKRTEMPLKNIKQYVDWCMEGDATIQQRLDMFREHKAEIERRIKSLKKSLEKIKYKFWYYETALVAGTIKIHEQTLEQIAAETSRAEKTTTPPSRTRRERSTSAVKST
jgi:DNA-binding transcriptional MerR regulator